MIDSTIITDPYIYLIDDMLSEDKCNKIIKKFNAKKNQQVQGVTAGGVKLYYKNSKDIAVSSSQGWKREDKLFHDIVSKGHTSY